MATNKDLLGSELMKEIVSIRIDTLWNMIALKQSGRFPPIDAEKATGDLDDKGALFVPGGLVFQDWEQNPIRIRVHAPTAKGFRRAIRRCMLFDGAHLIFHDGMADRVKLSNTAFAKIAANILENKRDARRRRTGLGKKRPGRIGSAEITRSYCPTYIPAPYGARTSLSSDLSVCLTEPRMYYRQCQTYYSLRDSEADSIWNGIRTAREPVRGKDSTTLAQPHLVTCHNTRYREEIYTGITRISGFGKFGEFATFTLEKATSELLREIDPGRAQFSPDELIADHRGDQVVAVLRRYPPTNPGARLQKGAKAALVLPEKDLDLDLASIKAQARKRYRLR